MANNMLDQLKELIAQLRDKDQGCPWILIQDFKSLATLTIEESYELADSIDQQDLTEIKDELSDLLLHVVLYAQLGIEHNAFDLDAIAKTAIDKQMRRKPEFHAHAAKTSTEALRQWEVNKQKERAEKKQASSISVLDGVTHSLPGINRAFKLQTQAATVGFDWSDIKDVFNKLQEEIVELETEIDAHTQHQSTNNKENLLAEMGDIFFTCVNLARHLGIDPELAIRHSNNKFETRFRNLEHSVTSDGKSLSEMKLAELDEYWEAIKKQE